MSNAADIAARTQRFNEAVRAFTPPSPMRHAKLMPLKDGIVELRQKGASLRLIRELLSTIDVSISIDSIARFLAEASADSKAPQTSQQRRRRSVAAAAPSARSADVPPTAAASPPPSPVAASPTERPRTRGPRIADPYNL